MRRNIAVLLFTLLAMFAASTAHAQPAKIYRIGIVREGGPDIAAVQGLKEGLQEFGLVEGTDYILENRDLRGDRRAIRAAAESLERDVDVIYTIATSVTLEVKRATTRVPVVFAVGTDPVSAGLVDSFATPGGRLTGVHYSTSDTTAKRLQILKSMLPHLRTIVVYYDSGNPVASRALKSTREAARQLQVDVLAMPVTSVAELRAQVAAFRPQDAGAFFYINDAMVRSQAQLIIDAMRDKKVPTMFSFPSIASQGALAGYGVSLREVGRLSSRYVHSVLTGSRPGALAVESVSRVELALNATTARQIGLTIPQAVLLGANEIFE